MNRTVAGVATWFVVCILCHPATAHAYLDPGSGSILLQSLVAGLLGAILAIRIYFRRLKSFLRRLLHREPPSRADPS